MEQDLNKDTLQPMNQLFSELQNHNHPAALPFQYDPIDDVFQLHSDCFDTAHSQSLFNQPQTQPQSEPQLQASGFSLLTAGSPSLSRPQPLLYLDTELQNGRPSLTNPYPSSHDLTNDPALTSSYSSMHKSVTQRKSQDGMRHYSQDKPPVYQNSDWGIEQEQGDSGEHKTGIGNGDFNPIQSDTGHDISQAMYSMEETLVEALQTQREMLAEAWKRDSGICDVDTFGAG
jgi:hypothetical protein